MFLRPDRSRRTVNEPPAKACKSHGALWQPCFHELQRSCRSPHHARTSRATCHERGSSSRARGGTGSRAWWSSPKARPCRRAAQTQRDARRGRLPSRVSPRGICLCLPTEDNCSVRPAAPSPSSAAGALRPPGRRHDGTWWARFGIITLVDLIDSRSAAALGAGSRGDCGGAINHDRGRVDRALAGHATSTAMSGLRARALWHQYLLHPLSLQHLVCGRGQTRMQTRCSGGISTARAARGRAPMMAPVCCRPWRTSRLPSRALSAVSGAADRRCTPSPRTGPRCCWWPGWACRSGRGCRTPATSRSC